MSNEREKLRMMGYSANEHGTIVCRREPDWRYSHEHVGIIGISGSDSKTARAFISEALAVVDEPRCLTGFNAHETVMLFRVGQRRAEPTNRAGNFQSVHEFTLDGKPLKLITG